MANILIIPCNGDSPLVVNDNGFTAYTTGNTYYLDFTGLTSGGCFTIDSITNTPEVDGISSLSSQYDDCLDCYQQNGWSYIVAGCVNPQVNNGPVNALQFTQTPEIGSYFTLCANNNEFEGCLCFEVVSAVQGVYPYFFGIDGPFLDCSCSLSANTEENICIEVCSPSGNTVVSVATPHPAWTNNQGTTVYQMNAITLGGPNGLNN